MNREIKERGESHHKRVTFGHKTILNGRRPDFGARSEEVRG